MRQLRAMGNRPPQPESHHPSTSPDLQDARDSVVHRLKSGQTDFLGSIDEGIFCRLGEGDLPIADFLAALSTENFPGWIVIEQDVMLHDDSSNPLKDVTHSLEYLRTAIPQGTSLSFGPSLRSSAPSSSGGPCGDGPGVT